MIEHDFDEEFVPIAAELQRLPYMSPSRDFADRVIAGIDRLQPARDLTPAVASRHLELHRGGQAIAQRRPMGIARATGTAVVGVALIAAAAFMFFEVDVLTAMMSAAVSQYAFTIAAVGTQLGALVLGADTIAYLQAGAVQAMLLYMALFVGLVSGYAGIRTAAQIANERLPDVNRILIPAYCIMALAAAHEASAQDGRSVRLAGLRKYAQVVTGDYTVPVGASTSGSVMVVRGDLDIYGNVDGAATAVLGDVIVHDGGRVRGGAVALGGRVINDGGSILGVVKEVGATHNRSTVSFGGRPRTTLGSLVSAILWLVVLLLVGTIVALYLRDYFKRAVEVVTNESGKSLLTGVVGGLLSIPALIAIVVLFAITIIGVVFIPIGVAAFLIAISGIGMLGFLAVAQVTGVAIAGKRE